MITFDYATEKATNTFTFPGGEVQPRLLYTRPEKRVVASIASSKDVMELMLITDALRRDGIYPETLDLILPYFPYARQDRVCQPGEALAVKVMGDLINSLGYHSVTVFDPHSQVVEAVLDCPLIIDQSYFVGKLFRNHLGTSRDVKRILVAPDLGAAKKVDHTACELALDFITATKHRDPATGNLTECRIDAEIDPEAHYLIVDDICDGGRTFINLAVEMRTRGATKIDLFVTHGIFSNGFHVFYDLIDNIYYTNSLHQSQVRDVEFIHSETPNEEIPL